MMCYKAASNRQQATGSKQQAATPSLHAQQQVNPSGITHKADVQGIINSVYMHIIKHSIRQACMALSTGTSVKPYTQKTPGGSTARLCSQAVQHSLVLPSQAHILASAAAPESPGSAVLRCCQTEHSRRSVGSATLAGCGPDLTACLLPVTPHHTVFVTPYSIGYTTPHSLLIDCMIP